MDLTILGKTDVQRVGVVKKGSWAEVNGCSQTLGFDHRVLDLTILGKTDVQMVEVVKKGVGQK